MKKGLTLASILILPYVTEYFVVYYDASKMVLGGVLMQKSQFVAYASRQLKTPERNYPTHDLKFSYLKFGDIICMVRGLKS